MPLRLPSSSSLKLPRCLRDLPLPSLRRVKRTTQCIEIINLDQDDADYHYQHEHHAWEQSPPPPPNSPASIYPAQAPQELRLSLVERLDDWIGFDLGFDLGLDQPDRRLLAVGSDCATARAADAPSTSFSFATIARTARGKFGRGLDPNTDHNHKHKPVPREPSPLPHAHHTPTAPAPPLPRASMNNPFDLPRWICCRCGRSNYSDTTSANTATNLFHTHRKPKNGTTTEETAQAARTWTCPCGHSLEPCLLKARLRNLGKVQRGGGDLGVAFVRDLGRWADREAGKGGN
ncbi:uncharacterized protein BKA78DRAFT_292312 [Phyllosticta capitalensis]|uniref:uncharacterized protein n=1 Tax=Phyllosticta capitalensis TaxID=121624 RepID=UPI00312CFD03